MTILAGQRLLADDFNDQALTPGISGGITAVTGPIRWQQTGDLVVMMFDLTVVTVSSGAIFLAVPVPVDPNFNDSTGHCLVTATDTSAGSYWLGMMKHQAGGSLTFWRTDNTGVAASPWAHNVPFTWAAGDKLTGTVTYLTAS